MSTNKILTLMLVLIMVIGCVPAFPVNAEEQEEIIDARNLYDEDLYIEVEDSDYNYKFAYGFMSSTNRYVVNRYFTVSCNTEVVLCRQNYEKDGDEDQSYYFYPNRVKGENKDNVVMNFGYLERKTFTDYTFADDEHGTPYTYVFSGDKNYLWNSDYFKIDEVIKSDFILFDTEENADYYFETGIKRGVLSEPTKEYDKNQVYLDNFYMEVHDSNNLDNWYIDFYYEPSQAMRDDLDNAYITVSVNYEMEITYVSGLGNQLDHYPTYSFTIPLKDHMHYYRFKPTMDKLCQGASGVNKLFLEKQMTGHELIIDFDDLSIEGVGLTSAVGKIDKSQLDIELYPCVSGKYGMRYDGVVDLLNVGNSYYNSSTPDTSGNYTSDNNITRQEGYYKTEVSQDVYGNNTYNYYYIDTVDNSKTEINKDTGEKLPRGSDNAIVHYHYHQWEGNPSGSSGTDDSGDTVVINDDDYTNQTLRDSLRDGFGLFDDLTTEKKNDGYLSLLSFFFNSINGNLSVLLGFGVTSIITINILRSIFKR